MFFELSTLELAIILIVLTVGATSLGAYVGRRRRHLSESLAESFGVMQGALLGVVGLILAFGLSLALSRYEDRRTAIVEEANAIGTTDLRAQTLNEPIRSESLRLLSEYTESAVRVSEYVPGSAAEDAAVDNENRLQRSLWSLAGGALADEPVASAPRLYVETLNEMFDAQTTRTAALNNQVPTAVLLLEILGGCIALAVLAAYLALVGRGIGVVMIASVLVAFLLFVTADLDRPTRGFITIPDTVLHDQLESSRQPPAAAAPQPAGRRP